jgi:serine/threonine protein kinase
MLLPFLRPQGIVGKQRFLSPETLVQSRPFHAHQVDIWSLGIILFVILTGDIPFEAALPTFKAYRMVREGQLSAMLIEWRLQRSDRPIPALSADAIDLMQSILRENPLERLSIEQIEGHRWMHASVSSCS